jgi:hypothetical protein
MRNSCNIVHSLSVALVAATLLGTTAYAQEAATGRSQPSMDSSEPFSSTATPSPNIPAQPSEGAVAATDALPTGVTTPATPQTTPTKTAGGANSFGGSDDELHDNKWHIYGMAYLWVPTMHGTVGVAGYDTNIHVSSGEIFSNFRGGFLGVFTPTYNRWSAPVDVLWMRLRSEKSVPYVPVDGSDTGYTVRATLNETIITPKLNYLAYDSPKFKVYGTAGARIWHIGTTLALIPSLYDNSPYKGVSWIDYVMGARFSVPLGKKASVDILGDGGEGGATLDYQVGGILNYQLKPKLTSQIGWRYLTEHYGNNGNILNTTTQGIVFGATYKFK